MENMNGKLIEFLVLDDDEDSGGLVDNGDLNFLLFFIIGVSVGVCVGGFLIFGFFCFIKKGRWV